MHKIKIAQFGAFDVKSYGDVLFPVALKYELNKRKIDYELYLFSPQISTFSFADGQKVYSYNEFDDVEKNVGIDVIVIGGGEMLNFNAIAFTDDAGVDFAYKGGEIWRKPIEFSKSYKIPYIVYGVGAAYDFTEKQGEIIQKALADASYVSVRDEYTYRRINKYVSTVKNSVDNLWDLKEIFPYINQRNENIVVQYGTNFQLEELITILGNISKKTGKKIELLSINETHGDYLIAKKIYERLGSDICVLVEGKSVQEIYKTIAESSLYIGTSLHGYLTAAVNFVPGVLVDMYSGTVSKLDGILKQLGATKDIVYDVEAIESRVIMFLAEKKYPYEDEVKKNVARNTELYDAIIDIIRG